MIAVLQDYRKNARLKGLVLEAVDDLSLQLPVRDISQPNRRDETRTLNRGYPPFIRRSASCQGAQK
jgi:hypothetical protein